MDNGTIYKIENLVNGKVYIGQTVRNAHRRMQVHLVKLRSGDHNNCHLLSAFRKYGEENFQFSLIGEYPVEELDEKEIELIAHYKSLNMSYNIEGGGNSRKIISDETRKKLSLAGKRAYKNPEYLKKRRIIQENYKGVNNPSSKKVICINDGRVFNSISEAGEYYKVNMKAISQSVNGRNPFVKSKNGKLEFRFYKEGERYEEIEHTHGQWKPVRCITTNEVFKSVREASEKHKVPTSNIAKVCKGNRKSAGKLPDGTKLQWSYVDD